MDQPVVLAQNDGEILVDFVIYVGYTHLKERRIYVWDKEYVYSLRKGDIIIYNSTIFELRDKIFDMGLLPLPDRCVLICEEHNNSYYSQFKF